MYDELRAYVQANMTTTHLFYLDEYIDWRGEEDEMGIEPKNPFELLLYIDQQARLDLYFQENHNTALDYVQPNEDGTFTVMEVETQVERVVRLEDNVHTLSAIDYNVIPPRVLPVNER